MTFDEYDKRCRAVGKSSSGLADEAGVTRTTISRWKNGVYNPSAKSMLLLTQALKQYEEQTQVLTRTSTPAPQVVAPAAPVSTEKQVVVAPDNSMMFDCIPKGAQVTLLPATPEESDIIACIVDGRTLIRKYTLKGDMVILCASNPKYFLVTLSVDEFNEGYLGICDKVTFHLPHA